MNSYTAYTLQNGSHKVGFNYDYGGSFSTGNYSPTLVSASNGWATVYGSPVADLNTGGQVVGGSGDYSFSFAAFSDPSGQSHGFGSAYVDNLNNYLIATDPSLYLKWGMKIDDLGRIIARGTLDGQAQDFLLTPVGPSSDPIPTPEPTTLATLAIGMTALFLRSARRRPRGK